MKILLTALNAKYIHSSLALRLLYASASDSRKLLTVKEFSVNNQDDYIFAELLAEEYDAICFSCYVWNIERIVNLAENVKKARPDVLIVFGGPETGFETVQFIKEHKYIDFIIAGEGEYAFSRLCRAIANRDEKYEKIKGLVYRKDGKIFVNPPAEPLNLELIPFPYDFLPCEADKILYYESARGCPFHCGFCLSSLDKETRTLSLSRVFRDVNFFFANGVKQVKFVDRTFNGDRARCEAILKYIMDREPGTTNFHFEIRGDLIDDEFLNLIRAARPGLFQFEVGVQSSNKRTLLAVNRSGQIETLLLGAGKLASLGNVKTRVDLIAGLPYESYHTFQRSFNDAYNLGADALQLGFLKLLKGTEIRAKAEAHQYEYRKNAPYEVIANRFISANDIVRLKRIEELLELYYNRGGFEKTLAAVIKGLVKTPFAFYEEFSFFYELKGFQHRSHKKEDLYRILYEYVSWKCKKTGAARGDFAQTLKEDLEKAFNPEVVDKIERKGWKIR